ncbi:MAG: hypothetical protein DRJ35_06395 [Thermoprotei archaeon]|nr:MAG: hypothetical protein DRJ35_06395 [Thermoprotei archaeon]
MSNYVTISAKVPRRLKELMDKYGIKPGPVIREALEREVRKAVLNELEKKAKKLSKKLPPISDEDIAKIIREYRDR